MTRATKEERQLASLLNAERTSRGLDPLKLETHLNLAADRHSSWMLDTGTFSHTGAGGSGHLARMKSAGFTLTPGYKTGENIGGVEVGGAPGYSDDVKAIHAGLMSSSGHRANILRPEYEYLGIGIQIDTFGGRSVLAATQNFAATDGPVSLDKGGSPSSGKSGGSGSNKTTITGTGRNDKIKGDGDDNLIKGFGGKDIIKAGGGADRIVGGGGPDTAKGGTGNDGVRGGSGNDKLFGNGGKDVLKGDRGKDFLNGGAGADKLHGGNQNDVLVGGGGRDVLDGGKGNDRLQGGGAADTFVFSKNYGKDRITDFQAADRIELDRKLWGGENLTPRQVVEDYGTDTGNAVRLDFGGDKLVVNGADNFAMLADSLIFG